jgi:hypothetical protein
LLESLEIELRIEVHQQPLQARALLLGERCGLCGCRHILKPVISDDV